MSHDHKHHNSKFLTDMNVLEVQCPPPTHPTQSKTDPNPTTGDTQEVQLQITM